MDDERIETERAPLEVELVERGRLLVAVPRRPVRPLTAEEVADTLTSLRRRGERTSVRTPPTR